PCVPDTGTEREPVGKIESSFTKQGLRIRPLIITQQIRCLVPRAISRGWSHQILVTQHLRDTEVSLVVLVECARNDIERTVKRGRKPDFLMVGFPVIGTVRIEQRQNLAV